MIGAFYLSIGLEMVTRCKAHRDPQLLHEARPDPRHELRPLVADYVLLNAIVSKHMVEYKFRQLKCSGKCWKANEVQGA